MSQVTPWLEDLIAASSSASSSSSSSSSSLGSRARMMATDETEEELGEDPFLLMSSFSNTSTAVMGSLSPFVPLRVLGDKYLRWVLRNPAQVLQTERLVRIGLSWYRQCSARYETARTAVNCLAFANGLILQDEQTSGIPAATCGRIHRLAAVSYRLIGLTQLLVEMVARNLLAGTAHAHWVWIIVLTIEIVKALLRLYVRRRAHAVALKRLCRQLMDTLVHTIVSRRQRRRNRDGSDASTHCEDSSSVQESAVCSDYLPSGVGKRTNIRIPAVRRIGGPERLLLLSLNSKTKTEQRQIQEDAHPSVSSSSSSEHPNSPPSDNESDGSESESPLAVAPLATIADIADILRPTLYAAMLLYNHRGGGAGGGPMSYLPFAVSLLVDGLVCCADFSQSMSDFGIGWNRLYGDNRRNATEERDDVRSGRYHHHHDPNCSWQRMGGGGDSSPTPTSSCALCHSLYETRLQTLKRRYFSLFWYVLRSPFFDDYCRSRCERWNAQIVSRIPLVGGVAGSLMDYYLQLQQFHFATA